MNLPPLIEHGLVYCPICKGQRSESKYLKTVIKDTRVLWLANMVTHYRHTHIKSWNRCWGNNGNYYRKKWFTDYENEKRIVNERAKRQIIRKCREFMLAHGIESKHFHLLYQNDEETLKLAVRSLDNALMLFPLSRVA